MNNEYLNLFVPQVAYKKRQRAKKRKEMELLMRDNLLNILTVPGNHNSNDAASVAEAGAAPAAVSRAGAGVPLPPPAITLAGPPTLSSSKNGGGGGTEDGGCRRRGGGRLERCTILLPFFPPTFAYILFPVFIWFTLNLSECFSLSLLVLSNVFALCVKKSFPHKNMRVIYYWYIQELFCFLAFFAAVERKKSACVPKKKRKERNLKIHFCVSALSPNVMPMNAHCYFLSLAVYL